MVFTTILSTFLCISIFGIQTLSASIVQTSSIAEISSEIDKETLVLFNISEVLMDSEISLGTSAWRKYVKKRAPLWVRPIACNVHDELTLFVVRHVAPKAPEPVTAPLIADLQDQGIATLAFTSRGRSEWYSTEVSGVDQLTESLLQKIGIDFSKTQLPDAFHHLSENSTISPYYQNGIIYANHMDKGPFLKQLLEETGYVPSQVIFVDDKRDSLETVETALQELGISFKGFWYTKTTSDHLDFIPMVAHLQLLNLLCLDTILSDQEAHEILKEFAAVDPDQFFFDLLEMIDFEQLNDSTT